MPLDQETTAELTDMRHAIDAVGHKLDELRHELREQALNSSEVSLKLEEVMQAFPDGTQAHRKAHEAMISASRAEERFWTELKLDVAKKGVWGVLIIIVGLIIIGAQAKLGLSSR